MKSLIRFGIQQNVSVNVIFVGLILFSVVIAIPHLPIERFPNIQLGEAQVTTRYPGASPEEVERLVTEKIEESLRGMENIEYVLSTSVPGQSIVRVKFEDDKDYEVLYDRLRIRVLSIQNQFPSVNGKSLTPSFQKIDVDEWLPVIQINLASKNPQQPLSKRTLTLLAKDLRTRLLQLEGVQNVSLLGDDIEQYSIVLNPSKLIQHKMTLQDVSHVLRQYGMAFPAGTIFTSMGERLVRTEDRFRSTNDLFSTVIRKEGEGNLIRLRDIIDLKETKIEPIKGGIITSVNGLDTVSCKVLKKKRASVLTIKRDVAKSVQDFLRSQKNNKLQAIITLDSSIKIRDGLGVLSNSLILSLIFVMTLLFLFMTNKGKKWTITVVSLSILAALVVGMSQNTWMRVWVITLLTIVVFVNCRSAILTVSGILFSFLGSLLVFFIFGQSINEITLLGFVLVSGIIVDDSIIVIENIQRHRESGSALVSSVIEGTYEVFWPVVSATLTTLAAFLPLLLMTGSTGDFFALIPFSVATALGFSLIECLLILPLHIVDLERILGKENQIKSETVDDHTLMKTLLRVYDRILKGALAYPISTVALVSFLFFLAVGILAVPFLGYPPILKMVFFPDDTSIVVVTVRMPSKTSMKETDEMVRAVAKAMMDYGENHVRNTTGFAGMLLNASYQPVWSNQYGFLFVELPEKELREYDNPKKFILKIRKDLEADFEKDGVNIEVLAAQDGPPRGQPVNIRVTGLEDQSVSRMANDLLTFMQQEADDGVLNGVIDLVHNRNLFSSVISFIPDHTRLALFDLTSSQAQRFIADIVDGAYVGDFRRIDEDIPIRVRLSTFTDPRALLHTPILDKGGGSIVSFGDIGKITLLQEPASLLRRDFQRTVTITGNLAEDINIGSTDVVRVVRQWYQQNGNRYPGVSIAFGGEAESTHKSFRSLTMAFVLAIVLIYTILASQFHSYTQPLLIMSNIIFSFTGVILVMALFGLGAQMLPEGWIREERSYITVQGFIAVIGLAGIVINDAIVLIAFINRGIDQGFSLQKALQVAGHQRVRPIIMTTVTTIAGLLPMAIGIPDFSITWGPFATCFIAGLSISTSMTLIVIPVLYLLLERLKNRLFAV